MYCEKCKRIIDAEDRCPACGSRHVRELRQDDLCFLTERDYVSTGILEDVLKQNGVPYLLKNVMGAGLAIKVGPMLDRGRFYVSQDRLQEAEGIVADLFPEPEET